MNEFTAKKLGEVLAFAKVGQETLEKGQSALSSVLGEDEVEKMTSACEEHQEVIMSLAKAENVEEVVTKKMEATSEKLRKMRDLYVGEQWDNPTELLEWSGFFEGAALVHWSLVKGAGEAKNDPKLVDLAKIGFDFHQKFLDKATTLLHNVGKTKGI
ncbi:hypothetical protein H0W91_00230 [Patescibacteria group bacterium]|nr:hypothetical protein [Patescibacteria group bacterium]